MTRLLIVLLAAVFCASADTVTNFDVDAASSLNDGAVFTPGTTYFLAFQLTGGTASDSTAVISNFDLGIGGSADSTTISESDNVTPTADGVTDTTSLTLQVTPADSYSYFIEQFMAGSDLQFTVSLGGSYSPPTPDEFAFQLYDENGSLVYDQTLDLYASTPAPSVSTSPEPSPDALLLSGVTLLSIAALRRRAIVSE